MLNLALLSYLSSCSISRLNFIEENRRFLFHHFLFLFITAEGFRRVE